jgi:hypothetical protein
VKGKTFPIVWREAIWHSVELDATAKVVGYTLSMHMNGGGSAFPSLKTIARESGLSPKNLAPVVRGVRQLEATGFLWVEKSAGRKVHHYLGTIPTVHEAPSSTVHVDAATVHLEQSNGARGAHELEEQLEEQLEGGGTSHEWHSSDSDIPLSEEEEREAEKVSPGVATPTRFAENGVHGHHARRRRSGAQRTRRVGKNQVRWS